MKPAIVVAKTLADKALAAKPSPLNRLHDVTRDQIAEFALSFDGEGHPLSDQLGALGRRISAEGDNNRHYDLTQDDTNLLWKAIDDIETNDPDAFNDAWAATQIVNPVRSAHLFWKQQAAAQPTTPAQVLPTEKATTAQKLKEAFSEDPPATFTNPLSEQLLKDAAAINPDALPPDAGSRWAGGIIDPEGLPPASTPMAGSPSMQAQLQAKLQGLHDAYSKVPEFIREDLLEGLLVGGGIAIPVAMMGDQDPNERAAAILGGIGAATFGGAAARRIGARIGAGFGDQALEPGSARYNLARVLGRKDNADVILDMGGIGDVPTLRNEDFGRAVGRAVGDEVFGVAGALGGLAAAQALDSTPDAVPQPTLGEVTLATVPGAAIGTATSGLFGSVVDTVGMNREINTNPDADPWELMQRNSIFGRRKAAA